MIVPTRSRIEKVCSTDPTRPLLCNANLRLEVDGRPGAFIEATNTYALARIPVDLMESDEDTPGPVPLEAVKASRKAGGRLVCNGDCAVPDGPRFPRPNLGKFPDTPALFSDMTGPEVVELRLNARFLYALAEAMGAQEVRLRFVPGALMKPVHVEPLRGVDGAEGLLMQIKAPS